MALPEEMYVLKESELKPPRRKNSSENYCRDKPDERTWLPSAPTTLRTWSVCESNHH